MKSFAIVKNIVLLLFIILIVPLTILEEVYKIFCRLISKIKLNYQLLMFAKQLTR